MALKSRLQRVYQKAQDSPLITKQVQVLDINDNPPVFSRTEYSARIDPSDPVGTTVVTVQATDLDAPGTKNSKV